MDWCGAFPDTFRWYETLRAQFFDRFGSDGLRARVSARRFGVRRRRRPPELMGATAVTQCVAASRGNPCVPAAPAFPRPAGLGSGNPRSPFPSGFLTSSTGDSEKGFDYSEEVISAFWSST